jgi:hypothetical protein
MGRSSSSSTGSRTANPEEPIDWYQQLARAAALGHPTHVAEGHPGVGFRTVATRTRRRYIMLAGIGSLAAIVIYLSFFFIEGAWSEGTLDECARDETVPTSSITVDWRWSPPGYDCVYLDDAGNEVERRAP